LTITVITGTFAELVQALIRIDIDDVQAQSHAAVLFLECSQASSQR